MFRWKWKRDYGLGCLFAESGWGPQGTQAQTTDTEHNWDTAAVNKPCFTISNGVLQSVSKLNRDLSMQQIVSSKAWFKNCDHDLYLSTANITSMWPALSSHPSWRQINEPRIDHMPTLTIWAAPLLTILSCSVCCLYGSAAPDNLRPTFSFLVPLPQTRVTVSVSDASHHNCQSVSNWSLVNVIPATFLSSLPRVIQ